MNRKALALAQAITLLAFNSGCGNANLEAAETAGVESADAVLLSERYLDAGMIPNSQISGLEAYAGKRATLFAVSGREGSIGIPGASIRMRSVLPLYNDNPANSVSFLAAQITAQGTVRFPAAKILRSGFEVANYLVLVVQEATQPEPFLRNADGSWVVDARSSRVSPSDDSARSLLLANIKLDQVIAAEQNGLAAFHLNQMTR